MRCVGYLDIIKWPNHSSRTSPPLEISSSKIPNTNSGANCSARRVQPESTQTAHYKWWNKGNLMEWFLWFMINTFWHPIARTKVLIKKLYLHTTKVSEEGLYNITKPL